MATVQLDVGLKTLAHGDQPGTWDVDANSGFQDANSRLTLSGSGDPNTVQTGYWPGQLYWDTMHLVHWIFNGTKGQNTGWVRLIGQGMIGMWSGSLASLPTGWVLADGTLITTVTPNYQTPDLKSRFIVGYDPSDIDYDAVGKLGGVKLQTETPPHSHNLTDPGHVHDLQINNTEGGSGDNEPVGANGFPLSGAVLSATTGITVDQTGTNIATNPVDNRPPFFVLAYLVKL